MCAFKVLIPDESIAEELHQPPGAELGVEGGFKPPLLKKLHCIYKVKIIFYA